GVSGATSPSLTITPAAAGDTGSYDVVVTSTCAGVSATSATAIVAVPGSDACAGQQPTVTQQPTTLQVLSGASASFAVAAGPAGVTFQWRKGGVNLANGGGGAPPAPPTPRRHPAARGAQAAPPRPR